MRFPALVSLALGLGKDRFGIPRRGAVEVVAFERVSCSPRAGLFARCGSPREFKFGDRERAMDRESCSLSADGLGIVLRLGPSHSPLSAPACQPYLV
jgi:hypothetical protein